MSDLIARTIIKNAMLIKLYSNLNDLKGKILTGIDKINKNIVV